MKNRALFSILIILSLGTVFISCEDYQYTEIEKQWQLREKRINEETIPVDSVFYGFRKGVFRQLLLLTDTESIESFGKYSEEGDNIEIKITYNGGFVWDEGTRTFSVKSLSSSDLILEYQDTLFVFRKY